MGCQGHVPFTLTSGHRSQTLTARLITRPFQGGRVDIRAAGGISPSLGYRNGKSKAGRVAAFAAIGSGKISKKIKGIQQDSNPAEKQSPLRPLQTG
jgi:hypothetical protein